MRFQDKVVVVTGAAQGIGWETAKLLASEGAVVAANDAERSRKHGEDESLCDLLDGVEFLGRDPFVGDPLASRSKSPFAHHERRDDARQRRAHFGVAGRGRFPAGDCADAKRPVFANRTETSRRAS